MKLEFTFMLQWILPHLPLIILNMVHKNIADCMISSHKVLLLCIKKYIHWIVKFIEFKQTMFTAYKKKHLSRSNQQNNHGIRVVVSELN